MVNPSMTFFNFQDFYVNAKRIKSLYVNLSVEEKRIYKMYVYSNRLLSDKKVDKVWEYLNEPFGSVYYVSYEMLGEYL
jgi:hypothetical protein